MDGLSGMLSEIIKANAQNCPANESDYVGEDGLMYCGECHTRKQCLIQSPFDEIMLKLPIPCECALKRLRQMEEKQHAVDARQEVRTVRSESLMDDRLREASFDRFTETPLNAKVLRACKRYAEHFDKMVEKNQGLLFYGGVGTGKTFAAACIANYLLDSAVPVVVTSFVKALESVEPRGGNEEGFIARVNRARLLVIDDLGAERGTDYALEKVYNIVDSRYRRRKPMILTTNLSLSEMKGSTDKRYARIYDRIFEVCYPLEFTDTSWRKREAARRYEEMKRFMEGDE